MLDFESINSSAIGALSGLLQNWLPKGKRRGHEYVVGDLSGAPGESLSINIQTGIWKDFNTGDGGSDPVSLYAAIKKVPQLEAAKILADVLGVSEPKKTNGKSHSHHSNGSSHSDIISPVPKSAPPCIDHHRLGIPTERWAYRDSLGNLLGYVARFDHPNGKKEILPQVFTSKGWIWKGFQKPRPLYNLDELALRPADDVLIVEGEKCAEAAKKLLPGYVVTTWCGGGLAVKVTDWKPLYGRNILIWPDRDRHLYPNGHGLSGEVLPYADQPGTLTGEMIAEILQDHCPKVQVLDVSEFLKDGYDVADCVADGWDEKTTLNWARSHVSLRAAGVAKPIQVLYVHKKAQKTPMNQRYYINTKDYTDVAQEILKFVYSGIDGPLRRYGGCWYRWTGSYYKEYDSDAVRADVYCFLDKCCHNVDGIRVEVHPDREMASKMVDALAATCHLAAEAKAPCWVGKIQSNLPNPKDCTALQNGILDLSNRKLYPHSPDFWSHNCVPYDYDPLSYPKSWLSFLASVWPNDQESIDTLQEIFGYLITSDTSFQKIFMAIGPKRAGKGTISRILKALLGKENTCEPTLDSLRNDFGLEQLIGKMLAVFSDVRLEGQTASITEHLLSISGEDAKSVNRKNLKHWNGQLNTRFLMMTNILPRFGDSSGALASRFIILTIKTSHYGKEDVTLTQKLLQELSGIFNWALDGLDRLRARGYFVNPKSSLDKVREFEELSAPIAAFLRESCIVGEDEQISCGELFEMWINWCREQGRDGHGTMQTFTRDLKAQDPNITTKDLRGWRGKIRHFAGVGKLDGNQQKGPDLMDDAPPRWVTEPIHHDDFSLMDD